jgi:hypothetical protein
MSETGDEPFLQDKENGRDHDSMVDPPMLENPNPFETNETKVIDTSNIKRDALERRHLAAYAVGHFSNDLCAAGWFFYLSFYLKFALNIPGGSVGLVILAGQIADGLTTPVVGLFSDRCKTRIGSRAPFYILGSIIVLPCFLFLFLGLYDPLPSGYTDADVPGSMLAFFMAMASIFNVGWAST